jgi:uncharacterized protein (TIGR03790 family)
MTFTRSFSLFNFALKSLIRGLFLLAVLLLSSASSPANETTPGDEVIIVYNNRVPESKALAEYYAQKRQVPTNQIFGFELSTTEEMSRAEFRDGLQTPLAREIAAQKLWRIASRIVPGTNGGAGRVEWKPAESRIRYAVLCYGVPVRILPDPNVKEEAAEKLRPELRRNEAAVDSELALLPMIDEHLPLTGPLGNPIYGTTNAAFLSPTNGLLLVSRLDGPTPEIARGLVDKALLAEAEGLWGRAYFDLRNTTEPGLKLGDDWLRNASELCRRLGFETVVDENPATFPAGFPMSQIALYMGWYDQDVSGPFTQPVVEFSPGAFAYHLHSFSAGIVRSTNKAWVGPLLAKGATATMGCVYEPFLSGTPDLTVFTSRLIFGGFSFGEAAYTCQSVLSWQTTIIGDPLYRPFGRDPEELKDSLLKKNSKWIPWYYLRLLNINLAAGKPLAQGVAVLEEFDATKTSAVLTEKLGDLYYAQGKPSSAAHAYEEALKLDPTPQQRLRLLLTLGERLSALNREPEAYSQYRVILRDFPNYPDKVGVYKRLLVLAQKLGKTAEASEYQSAISSAAQPPATGRDQGENSKPIHNAVSR